MDDLTPKASAADSLARVERMRALGQEVARLIRENDGLHQEHAALKVGILPRTYWRRLDGDDEASRAFQAEVLPAIHEQAAKALEKAEGDVGSSEHGSSAWAGWHKWKLGQRYRRIYGDLAKVELTGKDGGPIEVAQVKQSLAEKLAALSKATAPPDDEGEVDED